MNNISVLGRLASDVTTNEVNGRSVANFRIAAQTRRKGKDGQYITNFYNVAIWGAAGENAAKYLKKGHRAGVSGELVIRPYTGSDGVAHQAIEIDANSVDFVETKSEAEAKAGNTAAAPAQTAPAPSFTPVEQYTADDSLPF